MNDAKIKRLQELLEFISFVRMTSMPDTHKAMAYRAAERAMRGIA